jgi:hypothetical protein
MTIKQVLKTLLTAGLTKAMPKKPSPDPRKSINQQRSAAWVEALAEQFRKRYLNEKDVRVFSRQYTSNRGSFGLNEMLHDVCVCRVKTVPSPVHRKDLEYIETPLYQVESEFSRNSRAVLVDFSKLTLGSARYKLLVTSQRRDPDQFLSFLIPAARRCPGTVLVAMIPHPETWDEPDPAVRVWKFDDRTGRWR